MTTNRNSDQEQEIAGKAWEEMQARLREEPVNPAWATWETRKEAAFAADARDAAERVDKNPISAADQNSAVPSLPSAAPIPRISSKKRKRTVRFAVAAAAAALIATAVTPAGNNALASILNKFTIQDVVLVQESEMSDMMHMVYNAGNHYESINTYGSFSNTAVGNFDSGATVEQIRESLGYQPVTGPQAEQATLSAAIGNKTQMTLNVPKINEALLKLGAKHLFPQEADGQPITVNYPASVIYNFHAGEDDGENWAVLTQSAMPSVDFDSSFPVEETMDAVINFPYLPGNLRLSLQQTAVSSGQLPLPLFTDGKAQSFDVSGVNVTYTSDSVFSRTAFWINDGELFEFKASNSFQGGEAGFLKFAKGLAAQ